MPDLSLDLRYLRYALISAEFGSFRKAAEALGVPQSTVSRRVAQLEHRLQFAIFERDSRGVRLTAAGTNFLNEAATGVDQLTHAINSARSAHRGDRGEIHIGILASLSFGFLQLLKEFRKKHPLVRIQLHEGSPQLNVHRLTTGALDVCFVTREPALPGYQAEALWGERINVVLPIDHELAERSSISWDDLRREAFVVSQTGAGPDIHDYLTRRLSGPGSRVNVTTHEVGRESLFGLVAIGYGLTLVSTSSTGSDVQGITFRPIAGDDDVLASSAVWSSENKNPALKRLLTLARRVAHRCSSCGSWLAPSAEPPVRKAG